MKIYFIKVALRGVSPMVWRRLHLPGNTSLAQLHPIIQIAYHWDNEHLHPFHIEGKDYGIAYEGGLAFADNARKVFIDDFKFDSGDKFTYAYNFFAHYLVAIRIENIKESSLPTSVYCIKGSGMLGVSKHDEVEPTLNLLKAIINADDTITVDKIQSLVDALNAVKFNRCLVNQRLQTECAL